MYGVIRKSCPRSSKSQVWFHTERKSKRNVNLWNLGRKLTLIRLEWLTIYMGKPEILVGKSMVYAIPFGELQKIWAVIWCDVIFLFFLAFSAVVYFFTWIYLVAGRSPTTSNRQILQSREPSDYRHVSSKKLFSFCFDRGKTSFISFSDIYQLILRLWLLQLGLSLFSSIREWIFILVRAEVSD